MDLRRITITKTGGKITWEMHPPESFPHVDEILGWFASAGRHAADANQVPIETPGVKTLTISRVGTDPLWIDATENFQDALEIAGVCEFCRLDFWTKHVGRAQAAAMQKHAEQQHVAALVGQLGVGMPQRRR